MIPTLSASQAALPAERGAPAVTAQGGVRASVDSAAFGQPGNRFRADMQRVAGESESLTTLLVDPAPLFEGKEEARAERDEQTPGNVSEEPSLTPEQWLLAMIDQQQTGVQAHSERPVEATAVQETEPEKPMSIQALDDAGLAYVPDADLSRRQVGEAGASNGGTQPVQLAVRQGRPAPGGIEMNTSAPADLLKVAAPVAPEPMVESLRSATEPADATDPLAGADRSQAPQPQPADRGLKLQGPEAKWGEQMLHALREHVDLQVQQKIQSATIRLDPPELGSLEILLSHESGRLNVHLSAANADVARLLQQTSDRLRHELVGQHFVQVNVQVGAEGGGQQGQPRQRAPQAADEAPMMAREEPQAERSESGRARDVLVTV